MTSFNRPRPPDHPEVTGVCRYCGVPRKWPDDFYKGHLKCKRCCCADGKARREQDPERTRAKDRQSKAQQRRFRDLRDRVVLEMARRDPSLFHEILWEEVKHELSRDDLEDWLAKLVPPDPKGTPHRDAKGNYRREYGSLMFDKTQFGRKNRRELQDWYSDMGDTDERDDGD
jgi:hypothetical protein